MPLMTDTDYQQLAKLCQDSGLNPVLVPNELTVRGGDPYQMDQDFIMNHFLPWRLEIGRAFITTAAWSTPGHHAVSDSRHYVGCALDGYITGCKDIQEMYQLAKQGNYFQGIGIYPEFQPAPGLIHIDTRDEWARWACRYVKAIPTYVNIREFIPDAMV